MGAGRRILALGGHDFNRRDGNDAICDLIADLASRREPKICLLPTASGDPYDQISRFRRAFGERGCFPRAVSLFRLGERPVDLRRVLLAQDVIYVGGGSMINLIAIWRAHGVDDILRECWRREILIVGQSAGTMCWFEGGITSSSGEPAVGAGLGVLPGSACVHYRTQPARRVRYLRAIESGELEAGLGLEDQTGAIFEDRRLAEGLIAREGAEVWSVSREGGDVLEQPRASRLIASSSPDEGARDEILEFRRTLATRAAGPRRRVGRLNRS